jgi:uncharacterized membrane protein
MRSWDFSAPLMVVCIAGVLWLGSGWLCYQNWRRRGTARGVGLLEALRFLIITVIGFTLLKPELVKWIMEKEPPEVAVLYDGSASMTTRDVQLEEKQIIRRDQWVQLQRTNQFWKPWEKTAKVFVEEFSPPPSEGTNAPMVKEEGTDLNAALEGVLQRYHHLKAVLLLTDGDWNLGVSPISAATRFRARDIPIYSLSVGREELLPDLALQQVAAPSYGLLGEQVSIPFKIQSSMGREVRTTVSLSDAEGVVLRKDIVIPPKGLLQDTLIWSPTELGDRTLRVSIPVVEGEYLEDNNEQTFRIAVRTEKLNVLVVDSLPRWEYRYLRNALERDPGVSVSCLLYHPGLPVGGGTNYIKAFPDTKEAISKFDVIFLGDVGIGENELTTENMELVKGVVEQQGSGLVFLPGYRGRQLTLVNSPVGEMMPITYDETKPSGYTLPNESALQLTSAGRAHFLTLLSSDENRNEEIWKNLPGFFWCAGVLKSRPGSEVLGVHAGLRNASGRLPLLVTRPFGNGETLFMGTDAAWRWRRGVEDRYHYRFWGQVVRWMSHKRHLAAGKSVRLVYNPETPRVGESVYLNAVVFDTAGMPLEKGSVIATITAPSGKSERLDLTPLPNGWGVYRGAFIAREAGRHRVVITGDKLAAPLTTEIMVGRLQRERLGQPINGAILQEISSLSRGESAGISKLDEMVKKISLAATPKPREERIKLWANPWWAGLIVLLLGIYWTGRKIAGMI